MLNLRPQAGDLCLGNLPCFSLKLCLFLGGLPRFSLKLRPFLGSLPCFSLVLCLRLMLGGIQQPSAAWVLEDENPFAIRGDLEPESRGLGEQPSLGIRLNRLIPA